MDDLSRFCCLNSGCRDHGKRGAGNLRVTSRYGPDQARRIRGGGDQVVATGRFVAAAISAHVAGDCAEARTGQRGELPPPGPPELREPVQHEDQRSLTALRDVEPAAPDASAAADALNRVTIPQDVLDRIAPGIAPRASIIISDEGLSSETGKGTDFVAVLSNEPQGGLSMRHHSPSAGRDYRYASPRVEYRYAYPRVEYRSPYQGSGSYGGGWPFGGSRWGW